jgi:hypothetical protein
MNGHVVKVGLVHLLDLDLFEVDAVFPGHGQATQVTCNACKASTNIKRKACTNNKTTPIEIKYMLKFQLSCL